MVINITIMQFSFCAIKPH